MGIFDVSIPKWLEPVDQTTMAVAGYKGAMDVFNNAYNKANERRNFERNLENQKDQFAQEMELKRQELEIKNRHLDILQQQNQVANDLRNETLEQKQNQTLDAPLLNGWAKELSKAKSIDELNAMPTPDFHAPGTWSTAEQMRQKMAERLNDLSKQRNNNDLRKSFQNLGSKLLEEGYPEGGEIISQLSQVDGPVPPEVASKITEKLDQVAKKKELKALEKSTLMPPSEVSQLEKQLAGKDPLRQLEIMRDFGANLDPRYKNRYDALKSKVAKPSTDWFGIRKVPGRDEFGNPIEQIPPADKPPAKVEGLNLGKPDDNGFYNITSPLP